MIGRQRNKTVDRTREVIESSWKQTDADGMWELLQVGRLPVCLSNAIIRAIPAQSNQRDRT